MGDTIAGEGAEWLDEMGGAGEVRERREMQMRDRDAMQRPKDSR